MTQERLQWDSDHRANPMMADKPLAVEFKKPWNLLAEFDSAPVITLVAGDEISPKSNWRRGGDSNPRYDSALKI